MQKPKPYEENSKGSEEEKKELQNLFIDDVFSKVVSMANAVERPMTTPGKVSIKRRDKKIQPQTQQNFKQNRASINKMNSEEFKVYNENKDRSPLALSSNPSELLQQESTAKAVNKTGKPTYESNKTSNNETMKNTSLTENNSELLDDGVAATHVVEEVKATSKPNLGDVENSIEASNIAMKTQAE